MEIHEIEATTERQIHQGDRPVGGVHGADDVQVTGQ